MAKSPASARTSTKLATGTANNATIAATLHEELRGRVAGYTVGPSGLTVKLDCSAIFRIAVSVGADQPHFRSAVSMAMIAVNNRVNPATQGSGSDQQFMWVRLHKTTKDQKVRPALAVGMTYNNDADPFDIDGFVYTPDVS